jgi:DNA-binding NtrC family response regulator
MTYEEEQHRSTRTQFHRLIGASSVMQNIFLMIENIGKVDTAVLITGASGTGKELVADALHKESPRRNQPLVMVDCTAISDNLLESELFGHKKGAFTGAEEHRKGKILQAQGGTLFLDEIGDISMTMQLRLLRFLQEKTISPVGSDEELQIDVRVIAATNVNLKEKVQSGQFREDLYFRLLIIDIQLPLLKSRGRDINLLTSHFIRHFSEKLGKSISGISEQATSLLSTYHWPGNVRQLEHVLERACVLCPGTTITSQSLPDEIREEHQGQPVLHLSHTIDEKESMDIDRFGNLTEQQEQTVEKIVDALKKAGGNKAKAARILQFDRSTLYRKMKELHIDKDMFS